MLAMLNFLNVHNLPIFQPILMILVSKFMVHRALSDKTYLSLGFLSPLISRNVFLFYPPTLNIICFVEKNNVFLRFCLCILESDTVKSDCPVQIFRKMMKYLKI